MGIFKKLESEFDFDIVDEFLDHYEIMSEALEPSIERLRHKETYELGVEELFRIAHNLKSASGFLKLSKLNKLAFFLENYLEKLRNKKVEITDEILDWLYLISDQISGWYEDLSNDRENFRKIDIRIFNVPEEIEKL